MPWRRRVERDDSGMKKIYGTGWDSITILLIKKSDIGGSI